MARTIKIIISDEFYENELSDDITKIAGSSFAEGMTRMAVGKHFKDKAEVTISTDDVTDDDTKRVLRRAILECGTIAILKEHAVEEETN